MSIEIIKKENFDYCKLEEFLSIEPDVWFQHTKTWRDYTLAMRAFGSEDLSFYILENKKIVAFIPLVKEYIYEEEDKNEFFMAGFPSVYPVFSNTLSSNNKDKIEKIVFKELFELANCSDIDYINMYVNPLSGQVLDNSLRINPLPKFGFNDTTISTNILNLSNEESSLFRNFRKGTKSDIKTAQKNGFEIVVYDDSSISDEIFSKYKDVHFKAAGRKTRPDQTWEIMFEWIQKSSSILALTYKDTEVISAQLVNIFDKRAYYQSGATIPEYQRQTGIGHLAQWEIIKYLKVKGFAFYELGWNWYPNISQEIADSKMLGISRFKAGFGADIYPLYRGEWFKDKEYMMKIYKKRFDLYEG